MKTLLTSIKITVVFCLLLFVGYVLVLYGIAAVVKPNHGEVELKTCNGKVVGAENVGQQYSNNRYFWGRPSAVDYNGSGSGGSNLAPSNAAYLQEVETRLATFLDEHPYLDKKDIPSELVTASGSGLDPHISPAAAEIQIRRVAAAKQISVSTVQKLVDKHTYRPFFGPPYINLLELNVAVDSIGDFDVSLQ